MKGLREMILGEPLIARVLDTGAEVFLVGGYVRDLLTGARSKDIDFIVRGDIRSLLSRVFPEQATVIAFKKALTVRVVAGDYTMDFSELRGSIEEDLSGRDFTMNAIAWSPKEGTIDPLRGRDDIVRQRIKAISEGNFVSDPLRLLRAYRFAGELGWKIEGGTRRLTRKLAGLIKRSAAERITSELFRLVSSRYCLSALKMADKDGLAGEVVAVEREKLSDNIRSLSFLDAFLEKMREESSLRLDEPFSQGLTYVGLLRAEQLLYGSVAEKNPLRLSRAILKRVTVTDHLMSMFEKEKRANSAEMYDLFAEAGDGAMDFALLTRRRRFVKEAERFLSMKNLLPAERVMEITGSGEGPKLGLLIKEMRKMQFLGELRDENDAIKWLSGQGK